MPKNSTISLLPENFNKSVFTAYMIALGILTALILSVLIWKGKFQLLGFAASIPLAVLLVTHPKLAVGHYIVSLFIGKLLVQGQPWLYVDIAGLILIAAAILDLVKASNTNNRFPKLTVNFLLLLFVIFFAAIFSFEPLAATRPFGRVALLFLHFLALYRLTGKVSLNWCLNLFFWISVIHSIYALIPFALSGGAFRSFGTAPVEMPMLALVVATVKFLWSKKGSGWIYLAGMIIIFFALLAAQYRSLIMLGIGMSAVAAFISRRRAIKEMRNSTEVINSGELESLTQVRKRPLYLMGGLLFSMGLVLLFYPEILEPLVARFEGLLVSKPSGSFLLRFVLWKMAWTQFLEHPIVGMGPGLFNQIENVVPSVRMDFFYLYVRGLSAHNLLFHYMAEAGILGGVAVLSLMFNQLRLSIKSWKRSFSSDALTVSTILLAMSVTFMITTISEASWLWGQSSFSFAFFVALISRNFHNKVSSTN